MPEPSKTRTQDFNPELLSRKSGRDINLFWLLPAIVVLLSVIGGFGLRAVQEETHIELAERLRSSLNANVAALRFWVEEKKSDSQVLASNPEVKKNILGLKKLSSEKNWTAEAAIASAELIWLRDYLGKVSDTYGFIGFVIFNPQGLQIGALLEKPVGRSDIIAVSDFIQRVLKGETVVSHPFASEVPLPDAHGVFRDEWPTMFVATPIVDENGQIAAVLAFRMRPETEFSKILETSRSGKSGETYAFNRNGIMLSESRFTDDLQRLRLTSGNVSMLKTKITDPGVDLTQGEKPSLPADQRPLTRMAASATQGISATDVEGYNDYRGVRVVGSWTWLDDLSLGIATEIDSAEAFGPLIKLRKVFLIIFGLLVFATAGAILFHHRSVRYLNAGLVEQNQQNLLFKIALLFGKHPAVEKALPETLEMIGQFKGWEMGYYWAMDSESSFLHCQYQWISPTVASTSLDFQNKTLQMTFKKGQGLPGRVWETGQATWINNVQEDPNFPRASVAQKSGVVAGFAFPVSIDGEVFGIVELFSTKNIEPSPRENHLFIYLGNQLGHFLRRKREESLLIQAKLNAETANLAKSEFLARMSHELRTPLHAILGFGQLLHADPVNPLHPDHVGSIKHILDAGNHLLSLINEVLDLARIESGKMSVSIEALDVNSVLDEVLTLAQPLAEKHQISISNDIPEKTPLVIGDRIRLKQVLLNLVSNAVKYNRDNGTVVVNLEILDKQTVRIAVTDTGLGIPPELQKVLFVPFTRLNEENTAVEGTGIGLSISKHLVELMHGSIGFESEPGKGSCFFIHLKVAGDEYTVPKKISEPSSAEKMTGQASHGTLENCLVLYVEDNLTNLELVQRVLQHRPHINLIHAVDAGTGIEMARRQQPRLILMDLHLPDMDGVAAFTKLQGFDDTRRIPVIGLSASAMEEDIKRAKRAGFTDYLTKPIVIDKFLDTLDSFFSVRTNLLTKSVSKEKADD